MSLTQNPNSSLPSTTSSHIHSPHLPVSPQPLTPPPLQTFLNKKRNLNLLQRNYLIRRIVTPSSNEDSDYERISNLYYLLMSFNWNEDIHNNCNKTMLMQNLRGNSLWFYICSSYFPYLVNELIDNVNLLPDIVNKFLIERQALAKSGIYKKNSPSVKKEKLFKQIKSISQCISSNNLENIVNDIQNSINKIHEINERKILNGVQKEFILTNKYDNNTSFDNYLRMDVEYHSKTLKKFVEYIKTQNELRNTTVDDNDPDDVVCSVCNDGDYEDDNLIVYCALCHITVHQRCYGINVIPKDDWICQACRIYGNNGDVTKNLECVLCPVKGGAIKPCSLKKTSMFYAYLQSLRNGNNNINCCNSSTSTVDSISNSAVAKSSLYNSHDEIISLPSPSIPVAEHTHNSNNSNSNILINNIHKTKKSKKNITNSADSDTLSSITEKSANEHAWIHLSCALWIPEIIISNYELKDKIKGIEGIGKKRFMEKCEICLLKGYGPTIKCERCDLHFHVECARVNGFQLESTDNQLGENKFHLFCQKHAPHKLVKSRELKKQREIDDIKQFSKIIERNIDIYNKSHKQSPLSVYNKTKGEKGLIDSSNQIKLNNKEKRLFITAIRNLIMDLSNFTLEINHKDYSIISSNNNNSITFSYVDTLTPMKFPWYYLKETEPYLQCFKPIEIFRLYKSLISNETEYNKLILKKTHSHKSNTHHHSNNSNNNNNSKLKENIQTQITYCYCHKNDEAFMIGCEFGDKCPNNGWYHLECVDELKHFTRDEVVSDKFGKYICPECRKIHGIIWNENVNVNDGCLNNNNNSLFMIHSTEASPVLTEKERSCCFNNCSDKEKIENESMVDN